jgi:S-adenosylmethionine:tRNA ribosyltransferase-isomerase
LENPKNININQFDYSLPDDRIAKYPLEKRDESKLLVYNKGITKSAVYKDVAEFLPSNAHLVFNNTKVIQARIFFKKPTGATIEIFCLEPSSVEIVTAMSATEKVSWNCILGNAKRWKNEPLQITKDGVILNANLNEKGIQNVVEFSWNNQLTFAEILDHFGILPLPPYLNRETEELDLNRYQTVYAKNKGSVAAPTAGLHFTESIFEKLTKKGISKTELTLHVGAGTFLPVKSETLEGHNMHEEFFVVEKQSLTSLIEKSDCIVPVGTTSLRTLESLFWLGQNPENYFENDLFFLPQWEPYETQPKLNRKEALENLLSFMEEKQLKSIKGNTQIIIAPGYDIKMADGILTNFHQPKSTLLLLIYAFVGNEWKTIYNYALENDYRFLSYGDGSLLWKN